MKLPITILLSSLALSGCLHTSEDNGKGNCDSEIRNLVDQIGDPEEIQRYDASNYHSHTYWYWSMGFSRTFTWGENVYNCDVSDYTFEPI